MLTAQAPFAGERGPVMMLTAQDLRVALVTVHEPLARVPGLITQDRIVRAGPPTAQALARDFGIAMPRLAVAGLNPHAGDGGALGEEEIAVVAPAVAALRAQGIDARGPYPADSLFHEAARAGYDAALCLYHDQALIPVKMLNSGWREFDPRPAHRAHHPTTAPPSTSPERVSLAPTA